MNVVKGNVSIFLRVCFYFAVYIDVFFDVGFVYVYIRSCYVRDCKNKYW